MSKVIFLAICPQIFLTTFFLDTPKFFRPPQIFPSNKLFFRLYRPKNHFLAPKNLFFRPKNFFSRPKKFLLGFLDLKTLFEAF